MLNQDDIQDHVTFCPQTNRIMDQGYEAELRTAGYLFENLKERLVGDYRILVNYNLPVRGADTREIDLVIINKFGVFLLEVKAWVGEIKAYDDKWYVDDTVERDNALESVNMKARMLYGQMFGPQGHMNTLRDVSVTGLVVLTQGLHRFKNYSSTDSSGVAGLDNQLLRSISSTDLLHRGSRSRILSNDDIDRIYQVILGRHLARRDEIVENYRILHKLRDGDLFEAYEAENVIIPSQHVRMKRYKLPRLNAPSAIIEQEVLQFKRSVEVGVALGFHPHILYTTNFFPDSKRPDVFYEITELPTGERLDEIMAKTYRILPLNEQMDYLEPLCDALQYAHNYKDADGRKKPVYHRNICPETVFLSAEKQVKLADFDFAKFGLHTINPMYNKNPLYREQTLIEKTFTAPEVLNNASLATPASDIYALGVLWYFLARLPEHDPNATFRSEQAKTKIDVLPLPESARGLMKKMTAKVAGNRPQKIEEVASALQQLRQHK